MRWNLAVAGLSASFGFVSIIVGGVDLDAPVLVFYRCLFAVPAIGLALLLTRRLFVLARGRIVKAALLLGTTLGAHWFFFFETIKQSSVAFALLAAYLAPIIVALVAPVVLPERRSPVALAALVPAASGLALVALAGGEDVGFGPLALVTGLATALTYAALVIGTKAISERVSAAGLTFFNYSFAGLVMVPFLAGADRVIPRGGELAYVVLFGVLFTAVAGYLYIWLIRKVTAQTMGVVAYLEIVSGALLAWAILGEALTWQVVVGGTLIIAGGLAVVLFEPEDAELLEKSRIAA
jgi:drug/metabolite transporter (DMT)-like permease